MRRFLLLFLLSFYFLSSIHAQNVGINSTGATPDASAGLDISFTDKGILIPRVDISDLTTEAPVTSAASSLLVYNTNTTTGPGYYYWDGSNWIKMFDDTDGKSWKTIGNAGTTVGTNFLGTTDNVSLAIKTNGSERMRILNSGEVGIGTISPTRELDVNGQVRTWGVYGRSLDDYMLKDHNNGNVTVNALGGNLYLGYRNSGNILFYSGNTSGTGTEKMRLESGGDFGIGTNNPDDKLDVVGNAQVSGYLKVGNPTAPTSGSSVSNVVIYNIDFNSTTYWNYILSVCNTGDGGLWSLASDHLVFDNAGSEHYRALHSPYIWLPANINSADLKVELDHECTLENGYDGMYIEYTEDFGSTWTSISSWSTNGYSGGVDGCDQSCSQPNISAWTDGSFSGRVTSTSNTIDPVYQQGTWWRFRLVGMEDGSASTGEYDIYEFSLLADNVTYGNNGNSGFTNGDIYAEGHIYAQSTVQLGDVAEFFPVKEKTEPGDLIAMSSGNTNLCYLSNNDNSNLVIGVQSTAPSILVNNPKEGVPVALSGRVPVKVTNENGIIQPGDYLTASSKSGYAMKATKPCFIVGRAMQKQKDELDKIICIINPGWYNPNPVSEGVISGSSTILKGQKSITVFDNNISKYSRIFVTLKGNPGTYYWLDGVNDGSFTLNFDGNIENDVAFDYLVNNASNAKEINETINDIVVKQKNKNEKGEECKTCKPVYYNIKGEIITDVIVSDNPSSPPPDVNKTWTWDSVNGFKEVKK